MLSHQVDAAQSLTGILVTDLAHEVAQLVKLHIYVEGAAGNGWQGQGDGILPEMPAWVERGLIPACLPALEEELIKAGSSMEKVLKVNVYLNDIADYKGMNEAYKGRFGNQPPVRTTVAVAKGGVPGDSLVEMDCIAYI